MAAKLLISCILSLFLTFFFKPSNAAYNVIDLGAKSDGETDSTQAFLKAWAAACSSVKASTIYVPTGRYLIKNIVFRGPCKNKIAIQIKGTIVAPTDYHVIGKTGNWILFVQVDRVSVIGGTLDAQGAGFWACRKSGQNCPVGSRVSFHVPHEVQFLKVLLTHLTRMKIVWVLLEYAGLSFIFLSLIYTRVSYTRRSVGRHSYQINFYAF